MCSRCVSPYLLRTRSVCGWSPSLPEITLIFPLFQCFLSCTYCIAGDALLLSSLLAVFMSRNVWDRHNRRGYNVENLEISMMVGFFPFILAAHTVSTGIVGLYRRVRENRGTWQALWENGPCSARWMMLTTHFNRAARIQTLFMNIHMKLKAV